MTTTPGGPAVPAPHVPGSPPGAVPAPPAAVVAPSIGGTPGRATAFWSAVRPGASPAVLGAAAAVGIAGGALLVGHRPGLGAALVALAAWGVALPDLVRRRHAGDLALAGWSVLLLAVVAVRDASWLVALSWVVGLGAAAVALTAGRTATGVLSAPLAAVGGLARALPWTLHGMRAAAVDRGRGAWLALRTGAVALGLVLVFGALFASADPVFASFVPHLRLDDLPAHVVVGLLVAVVTAAAVQLAHAGTPWAQATRPPAAPARPVEWLVPVVALDVLMLAFLAVWVSALAKGDAYIRQATGLTYAQYARRGFGQLVVVTALTLLVVAVAARRAPQDTRDHRLRARVALGALCLGTLGVVASALARMSLYVGTYGLTRLRLLSAWGEVAMGVVVVLVLVAGVRWRGGWLPRAAVHVVAIAMLSLALVNPDALVVRYDAAATDLPGGLDVDYAAQLSADAVPAVDGLAEPVRSEILGRMRVTPPQGLAGWNLGRSRAAAVLAG
ncbi:MAG TPA: DUF4173 domain-containing protein [Cellulomonas sp.]